MLLKFKDFVCSFIQITFFCTTELFVTYYNFLNAFW